MEKCLICKKDFKSIRALHCHLKAHSGTQAYYQQFFPRFDLYDGSIIEYKNLNQYLSSFFNSEENRQKYYTENFYNNKVKELILNEIKNNANHKGYSFLPSHNYLILSKLPSISYIKRLYNSCEEFCKKTKTLDQLFVKNLPKDFWSKTDFSDLEIMIDTREQTPFDFKNSIKNKLDFGDYTTSTHYAKVFVERKAIGDFVSSMGSGSNRFEKELNRCKEFNSYIVMVVEGELSDIEYYVENFPKSNKPNLSFSLHNLRRFLIEYADIFQVVFCKDKESAKDMTQRILFFGEKIKNCDLQYFLDIHHVD